MFQVNSIDLDKKGSLFSIADEWDVSGNRYIIFNSVGPLQRCREYVYSQLLLIELFLGREYLDVVCK